MRIDQLGLLLWKNYIVRKRQPGILALIFFWPIVIFMILYTVRDNVDPEYHPTCQFPARSMPQDGLLPFVQSYVCSVGNPCDPLSEYEEVPSYKNATLGPLIVELQPMLTNKTIISAVETLPQSIQLLKSMAQILTKPEIKALFDRGIRLGDLFNNHEQIKNLLRSHMPKARDGLIDGLFESSVKLIYLIQTFGSSNIDNVICSPESLKKYLISPKEEDITEISNVLCNIDPLAIPDILENLSKHLDFTGLLKMVDRAMAKFREYNFFQDLKRATESILDLKTTKKYIPEYLRIREWLPKIILVFQNVTFKEIDLDFINKALVILDPVFAYERDWPVARSGFLKINRLLKMVKEVVKNHKVNYTDDFFDIINRLRGAISTFSSDPNNYENITQILDLSFLILQDGIKLTNKLLDHHANDFELAAEVFDGLKNFFSDNIVNSFTYIVSLIDNIVQMTHHVAILHEETLRRLYEISKSHQNLIQKILTNFQPTIYRTIIQSFFRLDFVERFVDNLKKKKTG